MAFMENKTSYQLLITSCPDSAVADRLARTLLESHLAACVNILPKVQSVYEWKGEIVSDAEVLLFIKTRREHYTAIEQVLLKQHPYDVPELIAISIETGLPSYLAWLDRITSQ